MFPSPSGPLQKYNSLLDTNLATYFSNPRKLRHLREMGLITEEGEIVDEVTFRMQAAKKEQAKTISQLRASAIVKMADEVERQRTIQLRQKLDHLSKMERVERIKQQRQHPKGVEEDFDPSYPNHHPQHEAYVHHTRPQSSMDILHQRLGVSESEFSLYTRMTKPKVVSLSSPLSPYSTSASHSKPVPPTKPKPLSRSLPTPKRRATFRQPLTSHDTSKLQGQPEVMLQYNGPTVHLGGVGEQRGLTDIVILQQHCGGNTVCVFKGKVKPKGIILFMSRRHRDCPFGLSMYTEGMIDTRLSVCCEYKHKVGRVLGCKGGHFKLIKVTGGKPCYKCQVAEEEESKRKEKEKIRAQMAEQQKLLTAKTNAQTGKEVSVEDSIAASIVTDLRMSTKASPNSVEDTEKIQVKEDPSSTTTHEVGTSEPHTAQEEGTEGKEENYEEEFEDSYSDISTTSSGASSSVQSLRSREETGRRESDHSISSTEDSDIPDSASNGSHGNIHIQNPSDKEDHLSGDGDHHDDIAASDKESHTSQNGSSCHGNNDKDGDNDVGDGKECEDSYRDDHNEPRLSDSPNLSSASSTTESDGFFSSKLERPLSPTFDIHVSVDHENTAGSGRDTQQEVHPHIPKITISTASLSLSDLLDSSDDERDSSEREKGKLEVVNNRATGYCGSGGDSDGVSGGNGDGGDGGGMNKSASSVTQGIDEGLKGTNADGDGNKGKVDDDRDENKADEEDGDGSRADNDTDVHKIEGCVDEHELGSGDSDGGNDDENKVDGDGISKVDDDGHESKVDSDGNSKVDDDGHESKVDSDGNSKVDDDGHESKVDSDGNSKVDDDGHKSKVDSDGNSKVDDDGHESKVDSDGNSKVDDDGHESKVDSDGNSKVDDDGHKSKVDSDGNSKVDDDGHKSKDDDGEEPKANGGNEHLDSSVMSPSEAANHHSSTSQSSSMGSLSSLGEST